jgi:hypothetical protein
MFGDCARRTGVGADLAGLAEFVSSEAVGRSGYQRHVRGDTRKTHTRTKSPADQGTVLAQFTQAGGNRWGDQEQRIRESPG